MIITQHFGSSTPFFLGVRRRLQLLLFGWRLAESGFSQHLSDARDVFPWVRGEQLGPAVLYPFLGEGSTKIDYRRKGTRILTSLEDLGNV